MTHETALSTWLAGVDEFANGDVLSIAARTLAEIKVAHRRAYEAMGLLRNKVRAQQISIEQMVDIACVMKKLGDLANDIRKESVIVEEIAEKVACLTWVQNNMNDTTQADRIKGRLAAGTPKVKQMVPIPDMQKDEVNYNKLMLHLGLNRAEMPMKDIVRLHWPVFQEYITQLTEQGLPLPPGTEHLKSYQLFKVDTRTNRDFDEVIDELTQLSEGVAQASEE